MTTSEVFQKVKKAIHEREIPVRIAWEYCDADQFEMELEERASANRFRAKGGAKTNIADMVKFIETNAFTYRKRHKDEGGDRPRELRRFTRSLSSTRSPYLPPVRAGVGQQYLDMEAVPAAPVPGEMPAQEGGPQWDAPVPAVPAPAQEGQVNEMPAPATQEGAQPGFVVEVAIPEEEFHEILFDPEQHFEPEQH